MNGFFTGRSKKMTLPKPVTVNGIEVKKVPIGRYIECMDELQALPAALLEACFPNLRLDEIVDKISLAEGDAVTELVTKLMLNAPATIIDAFVIVTKADRDQLLALTPAELLDVFSAWWALNDLTDFFQKGWKMLQPKITSMNLQATGGFSD